MNWQLSLAILVAGAAILVYVLVARRSRKATDVENGELKISLGKERETSERLRHTIAALGAADPTLDDLAGMFDDDAPAA